VIVRPEASRGALFVKLDAVTLAWGMPIRIDEGDAALFSSGGSLLGQLGPGSHHVDPKEAPFFLGVMSDPTPAADVVFVRTAEHGWWPMSAEPYALVDGRTGATVNVRFTGSFSVVVFDPRAFAQTMIVQSEQWLWAYVESVADRACRDMASAMMREGMGVADLTTEHGARMLADRTVADLAQDLAGRPLRVVRFGSLLVQVLG
jgi:membrane protease subunit (stomatin/prohibitin family)